jgi:hypothetical protein
LSQILQTENAIEDHENKECWATGEARASYKTREENKNELKTKKKKDLDFAELVRFLPFTLNNRKKKLSSLMAERENGKSERENLLQKSYPAQSPQFHSITNPTFSVRGRKKKLVMF